MADPNDEPRFASGSLIHERYRIISLLGVGGMGEVYRADDLKLGQPVALKFLPEKLAASDEYLERFLAEVRVARQVSHPNICRVHDVGEVDGQHFISMEYVDGEDLASLLRRIGHLPQEKAIEISQQICAGLQAAHDQGILHRDLKPANVMLDGRGQVRIADFGLAAAASELGERDARVGTPAYMAPEQLAGREVTRASDIYALGLVLFELFTGKPAFEADTFDELVKARAETKPSPSRFVMDMDPVAEAVIQRCLAHEPAERPKTARDVAVALPGGDPLAAALAAGETPSPELVAAAGGAGVWSVARGGTLLVLTLVAIAVACFFSRDHVLALVDPELPAPVLAHKGREIAKSLGYAAEPRDRAYGFQLGSPTSFQSETPEHRLRRIRHPVSAAVQFTYRESPSVLVPENQAGRVTWLRPPLSSGMLNLILGHDGSLRGLIGRPNEWSESASFDWSIAFAAAKLDIEKFESVPAAFAPRYACSKRYAWKGPHPDFDDVDVTVYGAELGNRPTHLAIRTDWKRKPVQRSRSQSLIIRIFDNSVLVFLVISLVGGLWLGSRNLLLGRGDRRNATRIAIYILLLTLVRWTLQADHVPSAGAEFRLFTFAASGALWSAMLAWFMYVGLEPTIRRIWPTKLVSWNRLLVGSFRDPLVGRDVLIGIAAGAIATALQLSQWQAAAWLSETTPGPLRTDSDHLRGTGYLIGELLWEQSSAGGMALLAAFVFVFFKTIVRHNWIAGALMFVAGLARMPHAVISEQPLVDLAFRSVQVGLLIFVLFRTGLLSMFMMILVMTLLAQAQLTLSLDRWYSTGGTLVLVGVLGAATFGFFTSTRFGLVADPPPRT